jgi:SpoVK/Ycf46/Vps4 family AAA+-type ATPase
MIVADLQATLCLIDCLLAGAHSAREVEMEHANAQEILVKQEHFFKALEGITPSVSEADMERYRRVQAQYSNTRESM